MDKETDFSQEAEIKSKFVNSESKIAEGGFEAAAPENEVIQEALEVQVEDLTSADLTSSSKDVQEFTKAILESLINSQDTNRITERELERSFASAIEYLASEYSRASISDILKLDEALLKSKILNQISHLNAPRPELMHPPEGIKAELKSAVEVLKSNIIKHANEQGIDLDGESSTQAMLGWAKKNLLGQSSRDNEIRKGHLKDELKDQLEFLENLEEFGVLTKALLAEPILYIDMQEEEKGAQTGSLAIAIDYSAGHLPRLKGYIEEVQIDYSAKNEAMAEKIIKALHLMSEGYGEEPFSEDASLQQFRSGMAFSPRTGNDANYLKQGFIKTVKVVREIDEQGN